ncbi:hypothetical protein [Herbaspirillum huttiense]|uniref:hypothetical protein n=1 Tax=Herbaspirillum huttiense TaxID=863372 RepID=UPI0005855563|nr:hypothetical protein [Herbaspirillum huttiense]
MSKNVVSASKGLKEAVKLKALAEKIRDVVFVAPKLGPISASDPIQSIVCESDKNGEIGFTFATVIGKVRAAFFLAPAGGGFEFAGGFHFYQVAPGGFQDNVLNYSFRFDVTGNIEADPNHKWALISLEKDDDDARDFREEVLGEVVFRMFGKVGSKFSKI